MRKVKDHSTILVTGGPFLEKRGPDNAGEVV